MKHLNKKSGNPDQAHIDHILNHIQTKYKSHVFSNRFNRFSKFMADIVGNALAFICAVIVIILWALTGHFFHYSDTWQLIINTGTTIITFLIVFLIQNTQNRDTEIINLKIDELIIAKKGARNHLINLDNLSDEELKSLEKEYLKLCNQRTGE